MSSRAVSEKPVTFRVDDVEPVVSPLPRVKAYENLRAMLASDVEACSDYHSDVVAGLAYHGLVAAVVKAHAEHRLLVLSPDMIWLTIVQGLSHHVALDPEASRHAFVRHAGRMELRVARPDFVWGSPENPWDEVVEKFVALIEQHTEPGVRDLLMCDFGTTGKVERAASGIAMMSALRHYFDYTFIAICGIPWITLEGTAEDWRRLAEKIERLDALGLGIEWWTTKLRTIGAKLAAAAAGQVDAAFFRNICRLEDAYGGEVINGWVAWLVPYGVATGGAPRLRNPVFEDERSGLSTQQIPTGLSSAPVRSIWLTAQGEVTRSLDFVSGFVGVEQREDGALRPLIGWAVRESDPFDQLLDRLVSEHALRPPDGGAEVLEQAGVEHPAEVARLYDACDGGKLFNPSAAFEVPGVRRCVVEAPDSIRDGVPRRGERHILLLRAADGSGCFVTYHDDWRWCVFLAQDAERPGEGSRPIIAKTILDFWRLVLDSKGAPFWEAADFTPLGWVRDES